MREDEVIVFIRECIGSVYAVELLLLIMRNDGKRWLASDLVRELRSSPTAVTEALRRLVRAGLITEIAEASYSFAPASKRHAQIAAEIERLYASAPISVMKAIVTSPEQTQGR